MMKRLALLVALGHAVAPQAALVAWIPLDGTTTDVVTRREGKLVGDAALAISAGGCRFGGKNGAVIFADAPEYAFGTSFSISAKVLVAALPTRGTSPAGQIVFRGDDRNGLDNFSLNLGNDGYYGFGYYSPDNQGHGVRALARIGQWESLLATFDANAHEVRLYIDGVLLGQSASPLMPFTFMERVFSPGLSIGNVQNPLGGIHNQPFDGLIRDVRLYNEVVTYAEASRALSRPLQK